MSDHEYAATVTRLAREFDVDTLRQHARLAGNLKRTAADAESRYGLANLQRLYGDAALIRAITEAKP